MDLLKDITRELRGGDETAQDGGSRTAPATRADSSGRDAAGERATSSTDSGEDASGDGTGDPARADSHVCSFCETEFDADRGACPDCDAEIVLRGAR